MIGKWPIIHVAFSYSYPKFPTPAASNPQTIEPPPPPASACCCSVRPAPARGGPPDYPCFRERLPSRWIPVLLNEPPLWSAYAACGAAAVRPPVAMRRPPLRCLRRGASGLALLPPARAAVAACVAFSREAATASCRLRLGRASLVHNAAAGLAELVRESAAASRRIRQGRAFICMVSGSSKRWTEEYSFISNSDSDTLYMA